MELYDKKLIVRGNYMINWCTHDGALSDIEVEYKENKGKLYHIKYYLKDSDEYLVVATTRPETFLVILQSWFILMMSVINNL